MLKYACLAFAAAKFVNEAKERAQSIVHMLENPQAAEDVAGRAARKTAETAKVTRDITTKAANQVCFPFSAGLP